jgi:RimJ/RimL family protein N-acetyltransferase
MRDVLRTARLVLHPVWLEDHAALLAHWTGPKVRRHLFDDRILAPAQVTEIIEAALHDFATEGFGLWALRRVPPEAAADDPALLRVPLAGVAGLRQVGDDVLGTLDVELVYSLEPDRWGQGLAAEASRAILDHAFHVLALPRVIAEIDEGNAASAELAVHLGMRRYEGTPGGPAHYVAERSRSPETVEA